jgi:hypothetical protein
MWFVQAMSKIRGKEKAWWLHARAAETGTTKMKRNESKEGGMRATDWQKKGDKGKVVSGNTDWLRSAHARL